MIGQNQETANGFDGCVMINMWMLTILLRVVLILTAMIIW